MSNFETNEVLETISIINLSDVNAYDYFRGTPLQRLLELFTSKLTEGDVFTILEFIDIMLKRGASLNALDRLYRTPLSTFLSSVQKRLADHYDLHYRICEKLLRNNLLPRDNVLYEPLVLLAQFDLRGDIFNLVYNHNKQIGYSILMTAPLQNAIKANNFNVVKKILETKQVKLKDCNGLLIDSVKLGNIQIVKLFLEFGVNANVCDDDGKHALYFAINNKHLDIIKQLVTFGALNDINNISVFSGYIHRDILKIIVESIDFKSPKHCNSANIVLAKVKLDLLREIFGDDFHLNENFSKIPILHHCIKYGNYPVVEYLVKNAKVNVNAKDANGRTPLHIAVIANNRWIILDSCINAGADLNAVDYNGRTPLHYAVSDKNYRVMHELLQRKVNPNIEDVFNITSTHIAISHDDEDFFKHFSKYIDVKNTFGTMEENLVDIALRYNAFKILHVITSSFNVNLQDIDASSTIIDAINKRNILKVQTLLELPFKNNNPSFFEKILPDVIKMLFEKRDENEEILKIINIIINSGCNLNIQDIDASSTIIDAINKRNILKVQTLLELPFKNNNPSFFEKILPDVIKMLFEKRDENEEILKIINIIINSGCNLNIQDENGKTPLHYIVEVFKRLEMDHKICDYLDMFIERGANVTIKDSSGKSPLYLLQDSKPLCKICFMFNVNIVLIPCGHTLCKGCSGNVNNTCPFCRSRFQKQDLHFV